MAVNEKHPIRNGIVASVAAGLILTAVYFIPIFLPKLAGWAGTLLKGFALYLLSSVSIPKWLLFVLIGLSAATVFRMLQPLWTKRPGEPVGPDLSMYTEDVFFDAMWRWDPHFLESSLTPYCPKCDTLLVYTSPYRASTHLCCETCNLVVSNLQGNYDEVRARVARQIDRKSRTGEWEEVVARQLEGGDH